MRVVDIRNEPSFVPQYLELRNRHAEVLLTEPVTEAETRAWLKTEPVEIRGMARGDTLEGVALLYLKREGEVAFFARSPGQGTGSRLLRIIEQAARQRGLASIWAWVRKENEIAQRAFEKNGYVPGGEESRTYRGEERQGIVYRKRIA